MGYLPETCSLHRTAPQHLPAQQRPHAASPALSSGPPPAVAGIAAAAAAAAAPKPQTLSIPSDPPPTPGLMRRLRRCVCCWSSRQQQDSHHPHALLGNPWAQGHSTHIAAPHGEQGAVLRAPYVVSAHVMNHSRDGVYPCIPTSQKLTALNSACTVN